MPTFPAKTCSRGPSLIAGGDNVTPGAAEMFGLEDAIAGGGLVALGAAVSDRAGAGVSERAGAGVVSCRTIVSEPVRPLKYHAAIPAIAISRITIAIGRARDGLPPSISPVEVCGGAFSDSDVGRWRTVLALTEDPGTR